MSQQEFLESSRYYEETGSYEVQEPVEAIREYPIWGQSNKFATRHLLGEKVHPQPDSKSGTWSLIPLVVLFFLIAGGAFGLTVAFHSAYSAPASWNGNDFAPAPEWHHHHHFHCQVIAVPDHQFGPGPTEMQGDGDSHFYIIEQNGNFCGRP